MTHQTPLAELRTNDSTTAPSPQLQRFDSSPYTMDLNAKDIINSMRGDTANSSSLHPVTIIDDEPLPSVTHTNPNPEKSYGDGPERPNPTRDGDTRPNRDGGTRPNRDGGTRPTGVRQASEGEGSHPVGTPDPEATTSPGYNPESLVSPRYDPGAKMTSPGYDPNGREAPEPRPHGDGPAVREEGTRLEDNRLEHTRPVTPEQISTDLDAMKLDPKVREIAGDIQEAFTKKDPKQILDALCEMMKANGNDNESLKGAVNALVNAFKKYGINLPMTVNEEGSLVLGGKVTVKTDGTYEFKDTNNQEANPTQEESGLGKS